jgi:CRP-like cAMP-binding protein
MLQRVEHPAGSRIITQGTSPDKVFLLSRGTVAVMLQLPTGREHRIATIGPGSTFGELALMDNDARAANVDAATDVVCYALDTHELEAHPAGDALRSKLIEQLAREMADRLRRADAEIAALAT